MHHSGTAFLCCLAFSFAIPLAAADEIRRQVTVSAQSEVTVEPDEALIQFTVGTMDVDLAQAKALNDEITAAALEVCKEQQIPPELVKILDFDLAPRHDRSGTRIGYGVNRTFEIRIHDFDVIQPFIYGLIEAGVEDVERVKFQVKDQRRHQMEARQLAFQYAQEKASHLAELSQLKLGPVISVAEDVQYNAEASGGFGGGFGGGGFLGGGSATERAEGWVQRPDTARVFFTSTTQPAATERKPERNDSGSGFASPGLVRLNATVQVEFELIVP